MNINPSSQTFEFNKISFEFSGGGLSAQQNKLPDPPMPKRDQREQKVFRLPIDLINALKRASFDASLKTGTRITEAFLVEQALRRYLDVQKA